MKRHHRDVHGVADKNTYAVKELKKPFECNQCGDLFTRKDNLNAHIKRKHVDSTCERFSCDHCEKTYSKMQDLNVHIRNSHAVFPLNFNCPLCDQSFNIKGNLTRHISKVHGKSK